MGNQKIVISEQDNIAVLFEDDKAVEFIIHRGDVLLGDVYLAQVENILPSIDAAFVNVGTERMGFLHSSDVLGRGELKSRLKPKQNLVVQVMKEPTGHKGPRVTMNIALPGRFLVLLPESRGISISRKIMDIKERSRLKSIISLCKPPGVGIIIRTESENQAEPELQEDFEILVERWQNIVAMADTAKPPTLLYRDQDILYRVIRELVSEDTREIMVDSAFGQQRAQQLLQNWGIDKPIKVTQYQGNQNIMVGAGIDKEIKTALQTRVPLPSGGYLYIQPTEALTVIDVNSGKFTSLESQAETIRLTNLEASKEIARQLRLRNIGGMIIVDFIDMESRANQLSILETFEMELSADKAKPQIGQLSDLGLVEMTRHRQGQSLSEIFSKKCSSCNGVGVVLDEFNWSPSAHEISRGRSKMPIRQQGRPGGPHQRHGGGDRFQKGGKGHQGGGGAKGGEGGQQGGQRGPLPKPGAPSLRKMIMTQMASNEPLRVNFLQQSKQMDDKEEKLATEKMSIHELYQHRMAKKNSLRLSNIVKLSYLPMPVNIILTRINPHINDIFTLVDAIEGAYMTGVTMPMDEDESGDDMGGGDDDAEASAGDDEDADSDEAQAAEAEDEAASDDEEEVEAITVPGDDDEYIVLEDEDDEDEAPSHRKTIYGAEEEADLEEDDDDEAAEDEESDEAEATEGDGKPAAAAAAPRGGAANRRRRGRPPKGQTGRKGGEEDEKKGRRGGGRGSTAKKSDPEVSEPHETVMIDT